MSMREEQRERERILKSEMRKAVPSLHFLLRKLDQRSLLSSSSLLPAIFFIFPRAGCDAAAESVCYNMRKEYDVTSAKKKMIKEKDTTTNRNTTMDADINALFDTNISTDGGNQKKRKSQQRGNPNNR